MAPLRFVTVAGGVSVSCRARGNDTVAFGPWHQSSPEQFATRRVFISASAGEATRILEDAVRELGHEVSEVAPAAGPHIEPRSSRLFARPTLSSLYCRRLMQAVRLVEAGAAPNQTARVARQRAARCTRTRGHVDVGRRADVAIGDRHRTLTAVTSMVWRPMTVLNVSEDQTHDEAGSWR
jgi:hypothetical protein